ncbi:hypothetical protein P153DRAFT_397333 [Dothidotthia symphoricarpi CBS 119687]|uniref:Zn(2)-C6 fungal-type domain-containing protein n=1 Tax=Dothidotthia symphoricarpi CBS 119687 TaxID=1392245 RepID=A0A6A6ABG6_9PLEO|nr:uncharacterized protein P153DRAFT_397333 [Dothidotthia symphoricarpi CBS 119687]KAF2129160.1 hypothetical protein P153DRAFT_397333 [Dothidotthia symphoricarpi CBS 119687]
MSTPAHARFHHDDSLAMNGYSLRPSPNVMHAGTPPITATYDDFDMAYAHTQAYGMGDGPRGSVDNTSEGNVSGLSLPLRKMSAVGSPGTLVQDGNNNSPYTMEEASGSGTKLESNDGAGYSPASRRSKDEGQETPQWSELKTKAGKERKRLPLACIACRRKKIRCSGEKPACKHCLRSRIPCVYKVTTRKAAPRTDYMAMLDKRLKRMEDRVIKLIPKESLPSVANVRRSIVKPPIPGAPPKTPATKKRLAEEAFGNELDDWSKAKAPNPDAAGQASRALESDENKLLTDGAESLPSREIQEHLTEVYFDHVYGQSYPLLHKPSFVRRLAAGKVPPVLTLAICAISARFSTHPQLRTEPCFLRGDDWAEKAREIALKRYDSPNITILIVYIILGLHEFGTCQGGRSWMFGGMAQRMAYALQLHKENEFDPSVSEADRKPLSATDREIRRRTMWSCFLMDRFCSSGTDRPLFVHEQHIELQLPVKEHLYLHEIQAPTEDLKGGVPNPVPPDSGQLADPRDNMGVTAYTIRLVCIWGKLIKYMNLGGKDKEAIPMWSPQSSFHSLKKEAKEFKDSLPEMLMYTPENLKSHAIGKTANSFLYLHILWQQIKLFIHRFALPSTAGARPPRDMPHDFLAESARAALDAANQISLLINEAMDHTVVAPFAGYSAFFSSTVHIHGVFSKNAKLEAQSKRYLAYNVKYLTKMKKYWGMFHYIAENLKDLYRQHADAQLQGQGAAANGTQKASIFQYGDWFDRYPHGVSKTDYEDAAVPNHKEPGSDAALGHKSDLQSVEEFFASLSPPSKGDQRKQARKNKSKSVSKPEPHHPAITEPIKPHRQSSQVQHAPHLRQQLSQINMAAPDTMDTTFDPSHYFPQSQHTPSQTFIAEFAGHSHPLLNTSPTLMHTPHNHAQIDTSMSPFPDLAADFNSNFWNMDPMGLSTPHAHQHNFFDPMSAYFVPFNVDPPTLPDADVFGGGASEAFGFSLGAGESVDIDMVSGGSRAGGLRRQDEEGRGACRTGSGILEGMEALGGMERDER